MDDVMRGGRGLEKGQRNSPKIAILGRYACGVVWLDIMVDVGVKPALCEGCHIGSKTVE